MPNEYAAALLRSGNRVFRHRPRHVLGPNEFLGQDDEQVAVQAGIAAAGGLLSMIPIVGPILSAIIPGIAGAATAGGGGESAPARYRRAQKYAAACQARGGTYWSYGPGNTLDKCTTGGPNDPSIDSAGVAGQGAGGVPWGSVAIGGGLLLGATALFIGLRRKRRNPRRRRR